MKTLLFLLSILFSYSLSATGADQKALKAKVDFYKTVFKDYAGFEKKTVKDTISKNPINKEILTIKNSKNQTIGYLREIVTTTGCDSACLPITATLFYSKDKKFLAVKSKDGLTKKFHAAFNMEDYQNLNFILMRNPRSFKSITHPKQMVDAISSETLKEYSPDVIKNAAYTSLRLNLYNQDTLRLLKD